MQNVTVAKQFLCLPRSLAARRAALHAGRRRAFLHTPLTNAAPPDLVATASVPARQVVLLEDRHVDEQAWHEVVKEEPRVVDDAAASRYAMSLTFVVSAALVCVALLIAYGECRRAHVHAFQRLSHALLR